MRTWRSGNFCVSVDRDGVSIGNNVGGSTLTSEGYACSLEEFLGGQLHDVIPAAFLPEVLEEAARLGGKDLKEVLDALGRRRRKAETGYETVEEATRAEQEWAELVRNTAESGPPKLWDAPLVSSVADLAGKPEHSAWARAFLERMLLATRDPWILGACIEGLSEPGRQVGDAWVTVGEAGHPRFGTIGEQATMPHWIPQRPPCARCGNDRTLLIFCRDGFRSDQAYDSRDAVAEVQCLSCGAFSVHVRHTESRC